MLVVPRLHPNLSVWITKSKLYDVQCTLYVCWWARRSHISMRWQALTWRKTNRNLVPRLCVAHQIAPQLLSWLSRLPLPFVSCGCSGCSAVHWVHCIVFRALRFSPMQFIAAISNPIHMYPLFWVPLFGLTPWKSSQRLPRNCAFY